jgi:Family of unknown function (DUF5684)
MNAIISITFWGLILLWWAGMWRVFEKAGEPGWAAIVPIYWVYVLVKIGQKPGWWMLWLLVPIANIFVFIGVFQSVAQRFNKGNSFAFGLMFLPFIFFPILGFGAEECQPQSA